MTTGEAVARGLNLATVRAHRAAQGMPETIADPEALALIATVLRAARAEIRAAA